MTDNLRQAAQQALEALENFARFQRMMVDGPDASDKLLAEDYAEAAFLQGAKAIPALRAALAEHQEPEHISSPECWCDPELDYKDPETGAEVWVHRRAQ